MSQVITKQILFLARKSQLCIAILLKQYGLTAAEEPFFMSISCRDGLTQEELTEIVGVDKAVTTRVLRSLEKKEFITRRQDEKDRRQNRIYATKRTKELRDTVHQSLLKLNRQLVEGIDPTQLEKLQAALETMNENAVLLLEQFHRKED